MFYKNTFVVLNYHYCYYIINKRKLRIIFVFNQVLDTFLALKIKEIDIEGEKEEPKKKKREQMSRRERKV